MLLWLYNFHRFLCDFIECPLKRVIRALSETPFVIFVLKCVLTFMICVFIDSTVIIAQNRFSTRMRNHVYTICLCRIPNKMYMYVSYVLLTEKITETFIDACKRVEGKKNRLKLQSISRLLRAKSESVKWRNIIRV